MSGQQKNTETSIALFEGFFLFRKGLFADSDGLHCKKVSPHLNVPPRTDPL
jgi:hypothetical protein